MLDWLEELLGEAYTDEVREKMEAKLQNSFVPREELEALSGELSGLKLDTAVEKALVGAGARNVRAVRALLDLTDAQLMQSGEVGGLSEQLQTLRTSPDSAFLFAAGEKPPAFLGVKPGESGVSPAEAVDVGRMNYEELCAYLKMEAL